MTVIALVSNKGGTGKTTLAMSLAAGLSRRAATTLVDADPQQSALSWAEVGGDGGPGTVPVIEGEDDLEATIGAAAREHRYVVVDCPPSIDAEASRVALRAADVVLVPVLPSPIDLWATSFVADAIADARGHNPGATAYLVINQVEPRTTLSRVLGPALAELALPVLSSTVRRRSAYRNCLIDGRTVYSIGARGAAAVDELEQLLKEIFGP